MNIDANNLAKQIIDVLGVGGVRVLPCSGIEIAVRTKFDPAAIVIGRTRQVSKIQNGRRARGIRNVRIGRNVIALDFIMRRITWNGSVDRKTRCWRSRDRT